MADMGFIRNPKRNRRAIPAGGIKGGHKVLGVRISDENRAKFAAQATADGYSSTGTWLKALARLRCETAQLEAGGIPPSVDSDDGAED